MASYMFIKADFYKQSSSLGTHLTSGNLHLVLGVCQESVQYGYMYVLMESLHYGICF